MENIEKYIFDPANPKDFKAYGLLRKIFKDKNNLSFVGYEFFFKLFEKIIFDKELEDEIWDKPANWNSLDVLSKRDIYINNYSQKEFDLFTLKKLRKLKDSHNLFNSLTTGFAIFDLDTTTYKSPLRYKESQLLNTEYFIGNFLIEENFKAIYSLRKRIDVAKNVIFFLSQNELAVYQTINSDRTSIIITFVDGDVEQLSLPNKIKPIFIKSIDDLFILFDYIKRDIAKTKNKSKISKGSSGFIDNINISDYFSIKSATFKNLSKRREIYLLGENGDGKTLLLQSILLALKGNQNIGLVSDFLKQNVAKKLKLTASDTKGKKYEFIQNGGKQKISYEHIYAYGVNRFRNDSDKQDDYGFLTLFSHDEYLENPLKWLQHLDYKEAKGEVPEISLIKAKEILSEILEKNVTIEVTPDGVTFNERGTILEFDQLSDGYKSVLVWVCDLLARLSTSQPEVNEINDFQGIVLVDEIGMFLHPKWQRTIVGKLRSWFPNIQFIFTTHSPIVVLGASRDAVFYKVYKEDGITKVADPIDNESLSHLMANSILTAPFLFGLDSARANAFDENKDNLDTSDDYLTGKIHEAVSQKLEKEYNINEENIFDVINEELTNYEATQSKNDKN